MAFSLKKGFSVDRPAPNEYNPKRIQAQKYMAIQRTCDQDTLREKRKEAKAAISRRIGLRRLIFQERRLLPCFAVSLNRRRLKELLMLALFL